MKDRQLSFAFKLALAFVVTAGLVLVLARISWVIYLVVIALLIVYSISPAVDYLRFKKMPRLLAVIIVYISFLLLLVLMLYLVTPIIITQLRELARFLPQYSPYFQPYIEELGDILARPEVVDFLLNFLQQLPRNLQQVLNQATKVTVTIVSRLAELVIVLFLVFTSCGIWKDKKSCGRIYTSSLAPGGPPYPWDHRRQGGSLFAGAFSPLYPGGHC